MSDTITDAQVKNFQEMSKETDKAWVDPNKMADDLISKINDQSTVDNEDWAEEMNSMDIYDITEEEVKESLEKPQKRAVGIVDRKPVPKKIPDVPKTPKKVDKEPEIAREPTDQHESIEIDDNSDREENPMSEASEVASVQVQLKELSGTVESMNKNLMEILNRLEGRVQLLEREKVMETVTGHKRILSGGERTLTLPGIVASRSDSIDQEELYDRCKSFKYTPSILAQKQILISLSGKNDIKSQRLPLTRSEWKPENLVRTIQAIKNL
jgi:hypothetical protein